jgi:thiamine pyrophosphate-dependent acetolactate synthase large subunit-like protein
MPRTLEIAIREAVGKRGVSVVVIPGDVALQEAADAPPPKADNLLLPTPVVIPAARDLDRLAALLNGQGRVTLFCGAGCQGVRMTSCWRWQSGFRRRSSMLSKARSMSNGAIPTTSA